MATNLKAPKRYRMEVFGVGKDWFLRILSSTSNPSKNKFAVTESYSSRSGGVRAAQQLVDGFNIPVARVDIKDAFDTKVIRSLVLRPKQKPMDMAIASPTPIE